MDIRLVLFSFVLNISMSYLIILLIKFEFPGICLFEKPGRNHLIFMIMIISHLTSNIFTIFYHSIDVFFVSVYATWIMTFVAISDVKTGRIPFVLISFCIGFNLFLGGFSNSCIIHMAGGMINLIVSLLIYFSGRVYQRFRHVSKTTHVVFGFGDVYAAAVLGFLFGFPIGFLAFLMALILAVLLQGLKTLFKKATFLNAQIRLGVYFYLAALAIDIGLFIGIIEIR